jgi:tRNA nucleotidyltransferase (CCA-adding enzyme)
MTINIWTVGGCVRDEIMGVKPNDIDFSVEADSFEEMVAYIESIGKIFLSTPDYGTVRARVGKETNDYVFCRKEGPYSDGRHPDWTVAGTIWDDLYRRDFTMNAIAKSVNGDIYDPFYGIQDIQNRIIRSVGDAHDKIWMDAIRLMRAARFSITKGFSIQSEIRDMFYDTSIINRMVETVSADRIRGEAGKMFAYDTIASIQFFAEYPKMSQAVFGSGERWLKVTNEQR